MRLPPALSEPSPQDVLLAQGGDRAAQLRVNTQRSRIRKRTRERERILAEQHDGAQSDAGTEGAEQSDARDGAGAVLDVATQDDDALPDDARGAGDADDAGFEDDGGFDGGFDDDDDDAVEQVCAQRKGARCAMALANDPTCAVCADPSRHCSLQVPCFPLLVLLAPAAVSSVSSFYMPARCVPGPFIHIAC